MKKHIIIGLMFVAMIVTIRASENTKIMTKNDFNNLKVIPIYENNEQQIYITGNAKKECIDAIGMETSGDVLIIKPEAISCHKNEYSWKQLDGKYSLPEIVRFVAIGNDKSIVFDFKEYKQKQKSIKISDDILQLAGKGYYLPGTAYEMDQSFPGQSKSFKLTNKEAAKGEIIAIQFLADKNTLLYEKYSQYTKQYIGFVKRGKRYLLIQYYCDTFDTPKEKLSKEILMIMDGGDCYFSMEIDLDASKVMDLSVNGEG